MTQFKQLINPHSHSDGSLDGAATIKDIVKRNAELGATHVSCTEHGNMNTAMDLYKTSQKFNIKPILGCELYMESPFMDELEKRYRQLYSGEKDAEKKIQKKLKGQYVHLTIHFKDEWAWQYFSRLSPVMDERAVVRWGERKPIATLEEVAGAAGHITICSSCLVGAVQKWLLPDRDTGEVRPDLAEKTYNMIRDIAGKDNFFVEVFPHDVTHNWVAPKRDKGSKKIIEPGFFKPNECTPWFPDGDMQKKANQYVLEMAQKYGDRILISLDSHFAVPSQKLIQDAKLGNGREAWKFYNSYHILSTDEAAEHLKRTLGVSDRDIEEWVDNSYYFGSLFDDFKLTTSDDRWVLQELPGDWQVKLKHKIDMYGRMNWNDPAMVNRLKEEIKILAFNSKMNLMSYMFTVEDVANFCKENGILMTVRGSAGGSLLLHLLGVSAVNPLKHNLSFGRFLTEGRIEANTLPDVDMDISDKDRVLQYLEDTYGDGFCKLSIDSMLKLKSSIKDAERAIKGEVSKATEQMTKKLPHSSQGADEREIVFGHEDSDGNHIPGLIDTNKDLKKWIENNPEVWATAAEMIGIQRQKSIHACGVVIADKPIQDYCPVITINGSKATAFNPKAVEQAGLIKYDFLGVNTLRDIELAVKSIKDRLGIDVDPWSLPYDEKVIMAFGEGRTESVFQFDTATVVPYLKAIKPLNIDDLSAITALCRPGTLDAPYGDGRTLAQVYVDRANGEKIEYIHPELEPIFKETLGIQLYQEQTIRIFKDLAGYSDGEAEMVRRGIGKKIKEVLEENMGRLKQACMNRGWSEQQVDLLIEQIMASSNYSFNKSHATSYAYVAYACMYLKEKYPLDWWSASLTNATKDEVASKFWKHVKDIVLMPDINKSGTEFVIEGNKIRAPLSMVLGVGPKAYAQLTSNAPYKSFEDFVHTSFRKRANEEGRSAINIGIAYKLIAAGVLDSLFEGMDLTTVEKFELLEKTKANVRGEKQSPVKEEYMGMTPLGEFMAKKELIPVYSEDLRPVVLPPRNGLYNRHGFWELRGYPIIMSGSQAAYFMHKAETSGNAQGDFTVVAYVIDEKVITYRGNKQATKMYVDCGGEFFETIQWPPWGEDVAPSGFKKMPVLLNYKGKGDRVNLVSVVPLLHRDQLGHYNIQ